MNKNVIYTKKSVFLLFMLMMILCSCGRKSDVANPVELGLNTDVASTAETNAVLETEAKTVEKLLDDQVLAAIKNYCCILNPTLEDIVNAKEYPVYWEIISSDEHEIVVVFRSYTGAQNRYYVDRTTGDTYVTEYVPGIMNEEQRTDESFNVRDYFSRD